MTEGFKVGDHVIWNSEAGYVSGTILRVHTKEVDYEGILITRALAPPYFVRQICSRLEYKKAPGCAAAPCMGVELWEHS
jgi:hypothetical protein